MRLCAAWIVFGAVACGAPQNQGALTQPQTVQVAQPEAMRDVVDELVWTSQHNTFVQALTAVEAIEALKGPGPFTVFAPTDASTQSTPAAEFARRFEPANRGELRAWVEGHLLTGNVAPGDLREGAIVSVAGTSRTLSRSGATWFLDGQPLGPPVECTNGILYPVLPE